MSGKERSFWIVVSSILIVLLFFVWHDRQALEEMVEQLKHSQGEVVDLQKQNEVDKEAVREYVDIVNKLEQKIQELSKKVKVQETKDSQTLASDDIVYLRKRGLDNPEKDIVMSLLSEPRLFDQEGVLGGTFGIYDPDRIQVIGREWVVADFEDGHKMGRVLLKYEVEKKGKIRWTILNTYLLSE